MPFGYTLIVLLAVIQIKLILLTLFSSYNVKVLKPTLVLSLLPTSAVSELLYLEQQDFELVGLSVLYSRFPGQVLALPSDW